MSVPFYFITAPDVEEDTELFQKAECVLQHTRQLEDRDHVENFKFKVIKNPQFMKKVQSTARIAAQSSHDSHLHNVARRETPVKVPYLCQKISLVVTAHSFALLFCRRRPFLMLVNPATPAEMRVFVGFLSHQRIRLYHHSIMSMLQKICPALDQVKA
jgi:hypothetical protein